MSEITKQLMKEVERSSDSVMGIHPHGRSICLEAAGRIKELEEALKEIRAISWGWDGDCGAVDIIDRVIE